MASASKKRIMAIISYVFGILDDAVSEEKVFFKRIIVSTGRQRDLCIDETGGK